MDGLLVCRKGKVLCIAESLYEMLQKTRRKKSKNTKSSRTFENISSAEEQSKESFGMQLMD